jgi:chromosome partitioning protein
MHSIAVVNMKGGVAKTTTAIHLAAGFAARGRRVLLVDTDPQGTVAHTLRIHPTRTLTDLLAGVDPRTIVVSDVRPGLDLIAATPAAFALEAQLAGAVQRETLLARALAPLSSYDLLVLDTSPAMSLLTLNALLCATGLVVPIGMDPMSIIGARQTLDGVEQLRALWPSRPLPVLAVVPTGVNSSTHATRAAVDAIAADPRLGSHVAGHGIRQCLDLTYATAEGRTIWEYAPRSRAADDYTALVDRLATTLEAKDAPAHAAKNQAVV